MLLVCQESSDELSQPIVYDVKSKLSGWDAIQDIPPYLRADIKREFDTFKAVYPIDEFMGVDLVLDYDELVSSSVYAGRVIPGRKVPGGVINILFRCRKAVGNLSNRRSPIYIAPKYPRKQELIDMIDRMKEICDNWNYELLNEIDDEEVATFLSNKFSKDPHTTIKELQPKLARFIENSLKQLYSRLDTAAANYTKRFNSGRRFGYYKAPAM